MLLRFSDLLQNTSNLFQRVIPKFFHFYLVIKVETFLLGRNPPVSQAFFCVVLFFFFPSSTITLAWSGKIG